MLHTKSEGHPPSGSGEKVFNHLWAWWPSWSCDQDHLNKLLFLHPKESPYEIWVKLAQWFQRRRCLKMLTDGLWMDARVTGLLLAQPWAFGSGELKIMHQDHQRVKPFGSRSGPRFCRAWSGSKMFATYISRQHYQAIINYMWICKVTVEKQNYVLAEHKRH